MGPRPVQKFFLVAAGTLSLAAACSLSPQPLPPGETVDGGTRTGVPVSPPEGPLDAGSFGSPDAGLTTQQDSAPGPGTPGDAGDASRDAPGDARADAPDASDASDADATD